MSRRKGYVIATYAHRELGLSTVFCRANGKGAWVKGTLTPPLCHPVGLMGPTGAHKSASSQATYRDLSYKMWYREGTASQGITVVQLYTRVRLWQCLLKHAPSHLISDAQKGTAWLVLGWEG